MITYVRGNIFDSKAGLLVNPVNCVGVMGAGLALQFKQRFPEMFQDYKTLCNKSEIQPGKPIFLTMKQGIVHPLPHICLFPTKNHWKNSSLIIDIEMGLDSFRKYQDGNQYMSDYIRHKSAAFPKLGCGLGGLSWEKVKPLMEHYLGNLDMEIEIYV